MYISLQPWSLDYKEQLVEYFNNINIWNNLRNYIPHPYTTEDAEKFILTQIETFPSQNFAIFNENELVGGIGINLCNDVYVMNVELGYWIAEPFWHQGIATIAVGLMTNYVFENFAINRIVAEVFEYNKPSMRVLEKNGYYLECLRRKSILKNNYLYDDYVWVKQKVI
ncbi:MAG: GNAT family N-acetyltransferase [Chitinophagaceae bacterium]